MTLIQSAIITSECSELISPFLSFNFHTCKKRGWTTKLPKSPLPVSNPLQLLTKHILNVFQVPNLVSCARGRQGSHIMILWGKGTGRKVLMYFLMTGHQDRCRPLPFPTPLDMRTAVLMSFPSWLWHIYLMQRAASMQNTTASINIIRSVQLAGDILAAAKCRGAFYTVMRSWCHLCIRADSGQGTISKLDGYLFNRPLLSHPWFHYLLLSLGPRD